MFLLLTWIGACPVEDPYVSVGQCLTIIYFIYFLGGVVVRLGWVKLLRCINSLYRITICGIVGGFT